jgi:hypothetical protein
MTKKPEKKNPVVKLREIFNAKKLSRTPSQKLKETLQKKAPTPEEKKKVARSQTPDAEI